MTDTRASADHHEPLRTVLLIGSVRSPRTADALLPWLRESLEDDHRIDLDVIDLAQHDLPLAELQPGGEDSPIAARLDAADAFVLLVPEYNHSFPASLKNAIDWHYRQWSFKPASIVSYGASSGGIRAAEQIRQVMSELSATTTRNAVALSAPWNRVDGDRFRPTEAECGALEATLRELVWWARALRDGRAAHPVPA